MISLDKIRKDLLNIRYYYARKKVFDSVSGDVGLSKVRSMVDQYNRMRRDLSRGFSAKSYEM